MSEIPNQGDIEALRRELKVTNLLLAYIVAHLGGADSTSGAASKARNLLSTTRRDAARS